MKKFSFLVLCIFLILQNSNAQFDIESFKTPAQQMVENALKPTIVVVCSSFQIRNNSTGTLFGLNGRQEFGEQISYGIKTKGGIILRDCAIQPWSFNEKFVKYKKDYSPVLCEIQYSEVGESAKYDSLDINPDSMKSLADSSWYYCISKTFSEKGLNIDNCLGKKNGWLLWIANNKEIDLKKSTELTTIVQQKIIEISEDKDSFEIIPPKTHYDIVGGMYVVPYYSIGSVDFRLVGIMDRIGEKWRLTCPFHDFYKLIINNVNSEMPVSNGNTNSEELTPINENLNSSKKENLKSKKKKKAS